MFVFARPRHFWVGAVSGISYCFHINVSLSWMNLSKSPVIGPISACNICLPYPATIVAIKTPSVMIPLTSLNLLSKQNTPQVTKCP